MAASKIDQALEPSDKTLREFWRTHGGDFHGPNIETGTMPELNLLPLLRRLLTDARTARDQVQLQRYTIKRLQKQVDTLREGNRMAAIGRGMLNGK